YAASAWFSGQLSPLARRPLLDGLAPPTPYRWVDPPPELASTNLVPAPGTFRVELGNRGSLTAVLTTTDAQVTLILPKGSFAPAEGERAAEVSIEPLAGSAVDPPPPPFEILGNVYRLEATYVPSDEPAELAAEARVVLAYPFSSGVHPGHAIVHSSDGATWNTADTNDLPSIQQADAPIDGLGYVAVTRDPTATVPPGLTGDESSSVATIVIVAGFVVLAAAAAVTLWGPSIRRRRRTSGDD
ncbi:MAG: hypothetical protein WD965_09835, partial [Actinomycetota bacterium]